MDCKWGSWSQWSACSKTCGNGVQERKRTEATKAKNGGKKCTGGNKERRSCTKGKCFKGILNAVLELIVQLHILGIPFRQITMGPKNEGHINYY